MSACLQSAMVIGDARQAQLLRQSLEGFVDRICWVQGLETLEACWVESRPQVAFLWEGACGDDVLDLFGRLKQLAVSVPVIVVSEAPGVESAVRCVRAGAFDYLPFPLQEHDLQKLIQGLQGLVAGPLPDEGFVCENCPPGLSLVGRSKAIQEMLETIRLVAASRCNPVLIVGETGTGKELAAQALHAWRHGSHMSIVAVNCATLTASLLESELFGHVKGAFTGADRDKTGLFELACGGSLFLDEISEMPLELQAKLLRVLQEKTFRKVGGTKGLQFDGTIITSSNRDLLAETHKGAFRKDLYYRLAVFPIRVPPLHSASRRSDIPLLARYFLTNPGGPADRAAPALSPAAEQKLLAHDWPGNVRELRNVMDRALLVETSAQITPGSILFDATAQPNEDPQSPPGRATDFSLEAAERELVIRALHETGWQRTRAAALLGVTRATLHAKIKRYDLQAPGCL